MMRSRFIRAVACALAIVPFGAGSASAAEGAPPPPTAASGHAVQTVAQGVPTPTAFAFGAGEVFVSAGGTEDGSTPGGVFVLDDGVPTRLDGSPPFSAGVVWHKGTLYVSAGTQLLAWSGWNGTTFAVQQVIYEGPEGFPGFNGLAISPRNGRIYAGVSLEGDNDASGTTAPFGQSILSLRRDGSDVRVVARGLRQPWQLTFVRNMRRPFGTVLGQENLGPNQPPDYIIRVRQGNDYGFPACNWSRRRACKGFAKPWRLLPAHSSPMGIDSIRNRLYVALFGGVDESGPEVVSIKIGQGTRIRPVLTGFVAPVVALATHRGWLYTGDLTGAIYRVRP
jgi:glucose/arabinose dehydrogenase